MTAVEIRRSRRDWRSDPRRRCAPENGHDPDLWYSENRQEQAEAIQICHRCPLMVVCRRDAERNDEKHGVWGGTIRSSRDRIRTRNVKADTKAGEVHGGAMVTLAVSTRPELFHRLTQRSQIDAVRVAQRAGKTFAEMARLWRRDMNYLQNLAGMPTFDEQVASLYDERLSDMEIATRLHVNSKTVGESRRRQGLSPLYGRNRKVSAA